MRRRAVFLDRDGVINHEVDYLSHPGQLKLLKGAAAAIRSLKAAGFTIVVISNQSGIGRGYFTLETLGRINAKLVRELARKGAELDAIYFCPHAPQQGCRCRKPKPYLVKLASRRYGLDLKRSWFVGDSTADVACGMAAGCRTILVATGYGGRDGKVACRPTTRASDLRAAAAWILESERPGRKARSAPAAVRPS